MGSKTCTSFELSGSRMTRSNHNIYISEFRECFCSRVEAALWGKTHLATETDFYTLVMLTSRSLSVFAI